MPSSGFQGSASYRWLHSDRMFVNDVEQTQRTAEGSQEVNDLNFIDLGITYNFSPRYSATLTVPFAVNDRSQVVRALNAQRTILGRFHTHALGMGDIRFQGNAWLLDPHKHMNGNVLLGAGFSAPTGDRDVQDNFMVSAAGGPRSQIHAVDQSIQLGSGGWGFVLDFYAYQQIVPRLNGFISGLYSLTPGEKYTPTGSFSGDYSITDSYLSRGGLDYLVWSKYGLSFSLAGRVEGVPVHDLVGGSAGFRRPGYAVSVEPGVSWMYKGWSFAVNVPIAVYRNREQSLSEKAAGTPPVAAGFADFSFTGRVSRNF